MWVSISSLNTPGLWSKNVAKRLFMFFGGHLPLLQFSVPSITGGWGLVHFFSAGVPVKIQNSYLASIGQYQQLVTRLPPFTKYILHNHDVLNQVHNTCMND